MLLFPLWREKPRGVDIALKLHHYIAPTQSRSVTLSARRRLNVFT